jgi:hypothetical protein
MDIIIHATSTRSLVRLSILNEKGLEDLLRMKEKLQPKGQAFDLAVQSTYTIPRSDVATIINHHTSRIRIDL